MLEILTAAQAGVAVVVDGRLATWYAQVHGEAEPLVTRNAADAYGAMRVVRALLVADGTLGPDALVVNGRELATGDHVRSVDGGRLDAGDSELPPRRVPGRVVGIEPKGPAVTVDFATWGEHRLLGHELSYIDHDYLR